MKDLRFADYFLFTQHSLSTFDNCPLKFRKRYLEGLKWDSFPDERVKKRLERGNNFHLLAHRYFMGVPTGLDQGTEEFGELNEWMECLEREFKKEPFVTYLPEYKLRMVTDPLKLEANFDLIAINEDRIEIWDWKTHGDMQGKNRAALSKRFETSLQTVVYMFVLKEQLPILIGSPIESEKICMCYWQPDRPHLLAKINYSDELHERFRQILEQKIRGVLEYDYAGFEKALFSKHCKYCEFNWFCNNDKVDFEAMEEDEDFLDTLDWDSIEEKY
ncbi:MAG: PD-(D/E)XK nuclease family protein [Clostridia bacterium]|nr:PD-(D/E)XK nuclease family protein [Clostridia bacterium]